MYFCQCPIGVSAVLCRFRQVEYLSCGGLLHLVVAVSHDFYFSQCSRYFGQQGKGAFRVPVQHKELFIQSGVSQVRNVQHVFSGLQIFYIELALLVRQYHADDGIVLGQKDLCPVQVLFFVIQDSSLELYIERGLSVH